MASSSNNPAPTISIHPAPSDTTAQLNSTNHSASSQQHLEPELKASVSDWPYSALGYSPALFNGHHLLYELQLLENRFLSKETAVRLLSYSSTTPGAYEAVLKADQLEKACQRKELAITQLFFINRFLIHDNVTSLPRDPKRLRISGGAFRKLLEQLHCSPALLSCLVDHGLPLTPCFRKDLRMESSTFSDFWYTIPVRIITPCTDQRISHSLSAAGSNQTDPSQYLHLETAGIDIRSSRIVVYSHYNIQDNSIRVFCFDFQDGRWVDYANEPYTRAKETLKRTQVQKMCANRYFVHVLMHSSAIVWWQDALNAYNRQVIEHEKVLLRERQRNDNAQGSELIMEVDTALHTMAAHLHRYRAEVSMIEENIQRLSTELVTLTSGVRHSAENTAIVDTNNEHWFDAISIRAQGLTRFVAELEMKTQTVIALSFNTNQMSIDRQIVDSSESMRNIMKATQEEAKHSRFMAKQSQEMAEDTRKDSISMKAIALLTMLFLPGTAFAAILSMPFFDNEPWLGKASRVWVWFALTTPSTVFAVLFYIIHSKRTWRKRAKKHTKLNDADDIELGATD